MTSTLAPGALRVLVALAAAALVGASCGIAKSAPTGEIKLPPGFRAELVYSVPLASQGSWVALCVDDRGRIIASDQLGALYRVQPSPLGAASALTRVERIEATLGFAQGLVFHKGQLYAVLNGRIGAFTSGLYRLSDSNNDDRLDRIEQLRVFDGEGEHGPHAVIVGPDGKSLYICCGNFTALPLYTRALVPPVWQEDQLLPRISDPRGHGVQVKAPGGWIARTNLDGNEMELFSVGYRNIYDIAFNADGELFTFDSDMEWDIGTPWYRPTRILHVASGSEFGFRGGNGVWPAYYPDTLPAAVDAGPGSPTGMTFGAGTKFPPKYQQALFAGDWSYGNIFAFHLSPHGASYRGEMERFASAMPLGVTDMVVRPQDGALYFAVGGRQSESALYRIVWTGQTTAALGKASATQAPTPVTVAETPPTPIDPSLTPEAARELRRKLEAFHSGPQTGSIDQIWPHLANPDRHISSAARVALEQQPLDQWREKALAEPNVDARTSALIAFARHAGKDDQRDWVDSIIALNFAELTQPQRVNLIRAAALGVMRLDPLEPDSRQRLVAAFNPHYPAGVHQVDRELLPLLIRLRADGVVDRALDVLEGAATQEEAIDAAMALSVAPDGWTVEKRTRLLDWFDRSARFAGGHSFFGYVVAARDRFIGNFPPPDRAQLAERIAKPLTEQSPQIETKFRPFVREWQIDELVDLIEKAPPQRDFQNGRKTFSAAGCYNCHRINGEGSAVGPDLTGVGGRFSVRDLMRAIVEPNQQISDQYQQMVFETNGRVVIGRVVNISKENIEISTDMLDPKKSESIPRSEIDAQYPSDASMMPAGLLNTLTGEEILDLTAFLRAGGNQRHALFQSAVGQ